MEGNSPHLPTTPSPQIRFEVEDTGIGIPPERLQDIFLPFHQVGEMWTRRAGTGLGLAISQQLVRMMGSELHVRSAVGEGTTFWFDLELLVVDGRHFESDAYLRRHLEQSIIGFNGDKRKVLLVDDNDENRALLRDGLSALGFEIMEAVDGREALNITKEFLPDLILMDLFMPVMDGFEATRQIRKLEIRKSKLEIRKSKVDTGIQHPASSIQHPVIIGVSASVSPEVQQESRAAGCDDFLAKPFQIEELLEQVQKHLHLEWIYAEPAESEPEALPLVFPPQEDLRVLLEYAEIGDITGIQEYTAELHQLDQQFFPFADRVDQLTEDFQFDLIVEWVRSHNDEP